MYTKLSISKLNQKKGKAKFKRRHKMKIIFLRHGDYKIDKLTKLGKKQASLSYYDLYYENVQKIYCSPITRTFQTASIIAKKLHIKEIIADDRLKEREHLRPESLAEVQKQYNENYLNAEFSMRNPEGCKEFIERVFSFLDEAINENLQEDKNILIVGHSSMAYVINSYFTGIPSNNQLVWMRLGNCSKIAYEKQKN